MKTLPKRILSMTLALCLCLAMLPSVLPLVKAASNIVINGVDIGYANNDYFTKTGESCEDYNNYHIVDNVSTLKATCHNRNGYDCVSTTDPSCNCMRYWPTGSPSNYQVDLGASQCFGFARYCQWKVYGVYDNNSPSSFFDITGDIYGSECTGSKLKEKLINCAPATHVRTFSFEKGWGHSFSIVSTSDYGVDFADCNNDGCCIVRYKTMSWDELAAFVKGYGGIDYANSYASWVAVPEKPAITSTTAYYTEGSDIAISWNAVVGNTEYWINLYKDGELIVNQSMGNQTTYTYENAGVGEYTFAVSANNSVGTSGGTQYAFLVGMAPKKTTASIDKTSYAEGDTITIKWTPEIGTTYYWINVRKDGELIVDEATGTSTSYTMEDAEIGEYTVAVSANNGAGNSGKSSIAFTVSALSAPEVTSAKTYYKPGQTVEVTWNKIDNAAQYIYYLAEYPEEFAYTTNVSTARVTENKVAFTDLPNGRYRMFVRSISAAEKWSGNSNWLTFYVYNYDYIPVRVVENDGHIYALYDDEMSWDFAKIICDEMGGYLATITSEEENKLITELIGYGENDAYWLGASNVDSSDYKITGQPFQWITGETFEYTNWKAGEPSQSGEKADLEHFLEIRKSYDNKWNDTANTNRKDKGFILEVDTTAYKPATTSVHGNSKYLLFDESIPWSIAKVYCETIGGHLATASSAEEDHAIHTLIRQGQKPWYFIGASKQKGEWTWVDGSKVPLSGDYANWGDTSGQTQTGPTGWGNYLMKYKTSSLWIGISNFYSPESNMRRVGFVCELDDAADTELEHSFTNYISNGDATCTVDGTKTAKCDYCNATDTIVDAGSALGHDYKSTVNAPTCTEQGYTTHTCTACEHSYADSYTDPVDHTPGAPVRENEQPNGSHDMVVYCSFCGEELSRESILFHTPGDINGDGEVDNKDLTRLFRYLSGYDVEVVEDALDVNGDGEVNNKDLTRLFQYLSGWDVTIN